VVDGIGVPLKAAYLLVAQHDNSEQVQWEVLAYALDEEPLARGTYPVDLTTLEGRELRGDALVVRSVDGAHVLRGAGPLAGFDPDELG